MVSFAQLKNIAKYVSIILSNNYNNSNNNNNNNNKQFNYSVCSVKAKLEWSKYLVQSINMRSKYVDDTTVSEVVIKGRASNAQQIPDNIAKWSLDNRVKLNSDKCKELRISFAKKESHFAPFVINNEELGFVNSAKLLGVTISNTK